MSSLLRRIQRQVSPSQKVHVVKDLDGEPKLDSKGNLQFYANPPRHKFYGKNLYHGGRGSRLGVVNEKDPARIARLKREAKRKAARGEG